jgi:hypothetical protein
MKQWTVVLIIFANPVSNQKSTVIIQPKVKLASKFERKFDQRTFVDKKGLFDGVSFVDASSPPSSKLLPRPPSPPPKQKRVESIQTIVFQQHSKLTFFFFFPLRMCIHNLLVPFRKRDGTATAYSTRPVLKHQKYCWSLFLTKNTITRSQK